MKEYIIKYSKELGFDLIGFTKAEVNEKSTEVFDEWLSCGYESGMRYLHKKEERKDLSKVLPGAKTVIVLAINYYHEQGMLKESNGRIARYAYGKNYHNVIEPKLKKLVKFIVDKGGKAKAFVDSGPIMERALAQQAGIGVVGKNGCLITEEFGSWVFLAEIITDLDLGGKMIKEQPFSKCRGCGMCINACPTKAIVKPGIMNASRCISYLTIENKDEISKELKEVIKKEKKLFGCDICQEVCPLNKKSKESKSFSEKIIGDQIELKEVLSIKNDEEFLKKYAGSALMRAKRKGLQRNAKLLYSE